MIKKIISGGQTGVDRAALDVAIKLGISHSGWVPKGRIAEDGPISYRQAEPEAKKAGIGMWSLGDKYISPREWRKRQLN